MLRHECVELVQSIEPVFEEAGYDLRVGDQIGDELVHVFVIDIASEIEDPKPVHVGADLIRRRDTIALIDLIAARCPFMGLLHTDHQTGHQHLQ